jgi:hypothetical protein
MYPAALERARQWVEALLASSATAGGEGVSRA